MEFRDFYSYAQELGGKIRLHRYIGHYKYPVGVVCFRVQPSHIAHIFLASQALLECEQVFLFIGSANKHSTERNPFNYEFRKYLLLGALRECGWDEEDLARVHIFALKDWSEENNMDDAAWWGRYLYCNAVNLTGSDTFAIYYSDKLDDIRAWFSDPFFRIDEANPRVIIRHFDRVDLFEGLSATKIREAIVAGDIMYLLRFCPKIVIQHLEDMQGILARIRENPREDTSIMRR